MSKAHWGLFSLHQVWFLFCLSMLSSRQGGEEKEKVVLYNSHNMLCAPNIFPSLLGWYRHWGIFSVRSLAGAAFSLTTYTHSKSNLRGETLHTMNFCLKYSTPHSTNCNILYVQAEILQIEFSYLLVNIYLMNFCLVHHNNYIFQ